MNNRNNVTGAVGFVGPVPAVVIAVATPTFSDADATSAGELSRAALVGLWTRKQTNNATNMLQWASGLS